MRPIFRVLIVMFAVLGCWGCKSSQTLSPGQSSKMSADTSQIDYTLIYMIHGDANYLYHDEEGKGLQADEQQMKEAVSVAREAKNGEVFIFHLKPEKKVFWLFPKKDRVFLHYRNGILLHKEKYSPQAMSQSFVRESQLYKKYLRNNSSRLFFLYFGHEIPDENDSNYFRSRPEANFNTEVFVSGLRSFLTREERFDLTVLSTCDNGTPSMVSQIQSVSRYLLASPQNLHLSHLDTHALLNLEQTPKLPTSSLADSMASNSFDRLSSFIQTAVTISIYDLQEVDNYLDTISDSYSNYRMDNSGDQTRHENIDCASLPFWDGQKTTKGVTVYYKPPNFGRRAGQTSHSGWGCQE
jgi:hypothetical protein